MATIKTLVKNIFLDTSLYYLVNDQYAEHRLRNTQQKKFYSGFIGSGDTVFDVGANVGQRTKVFASIAAKVVAVEPQAFCLRHLHSRFRFNKKVIIEPYAVDEKTGHAELFESDSHTISSMNKEFIDFVKGSVFKSNHWDKKVSVETTTLDALIARHGKPSFIKIDVEGYEINVLKGLSQVVNGISFEFMPMLMKEVRVCVDRIHNLSANYEFNYTLGEELKLMLPAHQGYEEFCETLMTTISKAPSFGDIYAFHRR